MPQTIIYPDAHPETTSVDGEVYHYISGGALWAAVQGGAGTTANDASSQARIYLSSHFSLTDKWTNLVRCIFLFDISKSSLPIGSKIFNVTLSLYSYYKFFGTGAAPVNWCTPSPDVNIYSSNPASNIALVAADYTTLEIIPLCDTPITYENWIATDPFENKFSLNSVGIAIVQAATDDYGIVKLGARNANYDVANTEPSWVANSGWIFRIYTAEQGSPYKPKLTIYHSPLSERVAHSIIGNKVSLEAIRNIEMVYGGRAYVNKSGDFTYESRYHRNA